jgi:hypothetical protein
MVREFAGVREDENVVRLLGGKHRYLVMAMGGRPTGPGQEETPD